MSFSNYFLYIKLFTHGNYPPYSKEAVIVGKWTLRNSSVEFNDDLIWAHEFASTWSNEANATTGGYTVPVKGSSIHKLPESICSRPCLTRQFRIQLEMKCCWECRLYQACGNGCEVGVSRRGRV